MAGFIKRTGETALDVVGNVISGAAKGLEGIYDMGAGVVGAVGGIFDKDFRDDVQEHIATDYAARFVGDPLNSVTKNSYLNDNKVGGIVEDVANSLGQMLPTVAVSLIPGVGPAASVASLGVSAAGNATESAFQDGADYGKGMLYGAASGAVEMATEKFFGGVTKRITGAGIFDNVAKSFGKEVADVGIKRIAKDAIGEGIEEIAAELANPALKAIYKGKGAFSEYGNKDYWRGVGEAGIVGAGTSLAYGGTVGRAMKSSGKYADVAASLEANQSIDERLKGLDVEGKLTHEALSAAAKSRLTNLTQIETVLKSVNEKQRADIIKRNKLSDVFEADGSIKENVSAEINRTISNPDSDIRSEYYTLNARGKESVIAEELEKISAKLNVKEGVKASREGAGVPTSSVRVFSGELTDTGRENLTKTKKALRALNKKGGADVSLIITEDIPGTNGVMVGDRMYITRAALESGKHIGTLVHEYTHFEEGTREYARLAELYQSDRKAFLKAVQDVIDSGYGITDSDLLNMINKLERGEKLTNEELRKQQTLISEVNAKMSEAILGNEQFINKLVREDASLAGKIIDKIKSLIEMLKNIGNSAARAEYRRIKEAEKLYLKAAEAVGNRELIAKILEKKEEAEKKKAAEAQQTSEDGVTAPGTDNVTEDANPDQNDKKTPLTNTDSGNMSVSDNDIAPRITVGMSEDERAKILQHLTLQPQEIIIPEKFDIDFEQLERSRKSEISSTLIQKLRDLGCLKAYQTSSVDVQFEFTGGGLRKSMNSQVYDYGGTLGDLAKVILNMQTLLDNAVLLEIHSDKAAGTEQENERLKNTYVLLSAFAEGENITPVQFEIKQYVDENNRLYLAVALTKIETSVVGDTVLDEQGRTRLLPVSDISLPHLIEKINPRDENFFKYIPNSFLNNEQLAAKERAFVKERKKYGKEEIQFSREAEDKNTVTMTRGEAKKRDANYKSDKVYSKSETEKTIASLTVLESLPPKMRKDITEELWYALNSELSDDKRKFRVSLIAKRIMNRVYEYSYSPEDMKKISKLESEIKALMKRRDKAELQKTKDKHNEEIKNLKAELSSLKENHEYKNYPPEAMQEIEKEIEKTLYELVEKGGDSSIRAKLEAEFDTSTAAEWKKHWENTEKRFKILGRLMEHIHKLDNFKKGRFQNASKYRTENFKGSIEQLTKINFRGNLNKQGTRRIIKELGEWYNTENELFAKFNPTDDNFSGAPVLPFDEYISDYIKEIGEGKGDISNDELSKLDAIVSYLLHLEETYTAVFKNGQYVDAVPEVNEMRNVADESERLKHGVCYKFIESWYAQRYLNANPITGFYDTFDEKGFNSVMFKEMSDAEIKKQECVLELLALFDDFKEKHKHYEKDCKKRKISFHGIEMDIKTARSLYMTLKDADAALGLVESGFSTHDGEKKIKDALGFDPETIKNLRKQGASKAEIKSAAISIAKKTADKLYSHFTEADKEFISIVERIYNKDGRALKRKGDEQARGYSRLDEEGGYHYTLVRDNIVLEIGGFSVDDKGRAASFNKHREDSPSALFILPDTVLLERYNNGLANYVYVSPVIHNFKVRLHLSANGDYKNPDTLLKKLRNDFANARIAKKHGESKTTSFERFYIELFEDIQGRNHGRQSDLATMLRGNSVKAMLAANPKTIANQTASLISAMSILNPRHLLRGFKYARYKTNDVDKYSALARIRNNDNELFNTMANIDRKNAVFAKTDKIGDLLMSGISWMDRKIVQTEWGWAQVQIEAEKGLKIGTEENKIAAGKLLDETLFLTQQNALVTTKSAAMRSDSAYERQLTTMTSDALQVFCKPIYSGCKLHILRQKKQIAKEKGDAKRIEELDKEIKKTGKQFARDCSALVGTAVWTAGIALLFRALYHRIDDDETAEDIAKSVGTDVFGNMISALPYISHLHDYYMSGYGLEDFSLAALNDLLEACRGVSKYAENVAKGEADTRQTATLIRKVIYAGGHTLGVPMRNAYNVIYSIIGFNDNIKYRVDDLFYKQSYNKDLAKAIEKGDDDLVSTILGIVTGERIGAIEDDKSRETLNRLTVKGYDVLPRAVGDTLSYNGTEYELSAKEQSKFKSIYAEAHPALAELVKLPAFTKADEETQADAIKRLYNVYYEIARNETLDTEETKTTLFARVLDAEELALVIAHASNLKADKDKAGNSISGSKKAKVQKYVSSLKLTPAEKYLIMGYLGYKNLHGEAIVKNYLARYKLEKSEKEQILKACGY